MTIATDGLTEQQPKGRLVSAATGDVHVVKERLSSGESSIINLLFSACQADFHRNSVALISFS